MCPACMASLAVAVASAGGLAGLAVTVSRLKKDVKAAAAKKVVRFRLLPGTGQAITPERQGARGD